MEPKDVWNKIFLGADCQRQMSDLGKKCPGNPHVVYNEHCTNCPYRRNLRYKMPSNRNGS